MATTKNNGRAKTARGNILTADLAGVLIVPAAAGRQIIVTDFWVRALGGSANCTAIEIQGSEGTVVAASVASAAATVNTIARPETGSVTATNLNQSSGAGAIPVGEGLRILATGTESSATSVDYCVEFITVAA